VTKNNIKTIVFDLGNVVVNFDHWIAVNKISHLCSYSPKEIFDMFFDSPLTKAFEKGKISPQEFYSKVKKKLKCDISYKDFLPIWNKIFFLTSNNLIIHKMIRKLKKQYKIFLLSNINKAHFNYLRNSLDGIFDEFNRVILSYKVEMIKPEKNIYNLVRKFSKSQFNNILYIDDREDLISAASKLGIKSIRYVNPKALKQRLSIFGVKV